MTAIATTPSALPPVKVRDESLSVVALALIGLAHVVLVFVMRAAPLIGTLHALATLVVGVAVAARRPLHQTTYAVAYIAGSEVVWRMTHATLFWEFGKYAVALVLVIALTRVKTRRNVGLAMGYFVLLLPSAVLTFMVLGLSKVREQLSFNLSGPLALALCIAFFSNIRMSAEKVRVAFLFTLAPVLGIAALAYSSTVRAGDDLEFTGQSNSITSGGFGPNQVSALLGLGLFFVLLMLLERKQAWKFRIPLFVVAFALGAQAALTFSRGGLVLTTVSIFVAIFYLIREPRARVTLILVGTLVFAVGNYVVLPRLESFTQGKLSERYTSKRTSRRDVIAEVDLRIFANNPALGVGPGVASTLRTEVGYRVDAHTEFTRMVAEHGVLGVLASLILVILGVRVTRQARTMRSRAMVGAMLCWFTLYLLVNAMRLVAPVFVFGLACSIAYSWRPRKIA
jgi:hypothetical protein